MVDNKKMIRRKETIKRITNPWKEHKTTLSIINCNSNCPLNDKTIKLKVIN